MIEKYLKEKQYIGIFLLRVFIGCRLLYGVIDNILSWEKMIEFSHFLNSNNFYFPLTSAVISVYVQFFGSILILIGYKLRFTTFIISINFIVALIFVHIRIDDTIEGMTPALAMLFGCLALFFHGTDKISLDNYLKSK
ncbi:DoxX family protein [Polaribacter uvawellassae]|uniref:DoxX family protein n=1 Tax=Polaribacter uvawellassae TaxID=3133495 RepID=UPI00321AD339